LFAVACPSGLTTFAKLVPDNKLVKRSQGQMPNGLLYTDAVFSDPSG
jgi:hypothetical protein